MEDGIGTLVYLIITIVILVITALGKKKKQETLADEGVFDDFDDYENKEQKDPFSTLREILNEEPPEVTYEEPEPERLAQKEKPAPVIEPRKTYSTLIDGDVKSNIEKSRLRMDQLIKDNIKTDYNIDIPGDSNEIYNFDYNLQEAMEESMNEDFSDFDLKKAIIYSEIINRKDFI